MMRAKEYRTKARLSLKGNWMFLYVLFVCSSSTILVPADSARFIWVAVFLFSTFVSAVANISTLSLAEGKKLDINDITDYFSKAAKLLILSFSIFIMIFLWSLLFVIPGIIKAYSYSMAYYVFKEEPELSTAEIIRKSKDLMQGNKARLFRLDISFILWVLIPFIIIVVFSTMTYLGLTNTNHINFQQGFIVGILFVGAGYIINIVYGLYYAFLGMYIQVSHAHFYIDLRAPDLFADTLVQAQPEIATADYTATLPKDANDSDKNRLN